MKKAGFSVILIICSLAFLFSPAIAHDRKGHNDEIELVLFGQRGYKGATQEEKEALQAIEYAVYLSIDQFNNNGKEEFDYLKSRGIPNMPASLSEINFFDSSHHRYYTHRGWNVYAVKDIANWTERKKLLIGTVKQELFTRKDTPLQWFPWLSEQIYGQKGNEQQQEKFAILLYCVHLGVLPLCQYLCTPSKSPYLLRFLGLRLCTPPSGDL